MAIGSHKHDQTIASTVWTVNHNLDVTVAAIDVVVGGEVMFPQSITELDSNTLQVNFSSPQTGFARVSGALDLPPNVAPEGPSGPTYPPQEMSFVINASATSWGSFNENTWGSQSDMNDAGDLLIVSNPYTFGGVGPNGHVITYERSGDTWTEVDVIQGPNNHNMGWDLSLSGDGNTMVVTFKPSVITGDKGAFRHYTRNGSGWTQDWTYTSPYFDGELGDAIAMAKDQENIVVWCSNGSGSINGRFSVVDGQVEVATYYVGNGTSESYQACDISNDGTLAVIGAEASTQHANGYCAFVIRDSGGGTWDVGSPEILSEAAASGYGQSIAVSGDGQVLAVGAPGSKKVFIYDNNGSAFALRGEITNTPTLFGKNLAFNDDGSVLVIGCADGSVNERFTSANRDAFVYQYANSSWSVIQTISPESNQQAWGTSVAINEDGGTFFVAGHKLNQSGASKGFTDGTGIFD